MQKATVGGQTLGGRIAAMMGLTAAVSTDVPVVGRDEPVRHLTFGRKKMQKDVKFKDRLYRVFHSPGRVLAGPARPTAPNKGAPLNQVRFSTGAQLIFSDGSFRNPGRRKLLVLRKGQEDKQPVTLSGRQLRKLRKRTRAIFKASQAVGATT